jgi:hypothetical protein
MTSRPIRLAALAGLALLIAACGATAATAAPTGAAPTATPAATEAPTEGQATEAPTDAATNEPLPSLPDLSSIFGSVDLLDSLDRYKISVEIAGASGTTMMNVTTIREPVVASQIDMNTAGQEISIIRIADKAWLNQGGMGYTEVPAAAVANLTDVLAPEKLLSSFQNQAAFQYLEATGTESKNGVQATHYHVDDQTTLPPGSETIPPGVVGDIWVSEEGYLVAVEMAGLNTDVAGQGTIESMKIEVTNINDTGLTVEPPK